MEKETYCLACLALQIVVVKNLDLLKNNKQWEY